jgi:hypothetical protein
MGRVSRSHSVFPFEWEINYRRVPRFRRAPSYADEDYGLSLVAHDTYRLHMRELEARFAVDSRWFGFAPCVGTTHGLRDG